MRTLALALAATLTIPMTASGQDSNMVLAPGEIERILREDDLNVINIVTSRGLNAERTYQATVQLGPSSMIQMKYAPAPRGAEEFNNRPSYELGAYALQKLFLDPEEYVVPPTVARCFALDQIQSALDMVPVDYKPEAERTFDEWNMGLVVLQYWLWNVEVPEPRDLDDDDRIEGNELYERHIGNFNILTYLIRHNDSNRGNFLISTDPANPRVFSVDNGVAFSNEESDRGYYWRDLRLDRYPARAIERLRRYTLDDLYRELGVLAQFEVRGGAFVETEPGENLDPGRRVRRTDSMIQIGLSDSEIRNVHERLERLLGWIDGGRYRVFTG